MKMKMYSNLENLYLQESNITANVQSFVAGDRDIKDNFEFDPGQNEDYLDFSAIVRKIANAPTKRLITVFDHFVIENSDPEILFLWILMIQISMERHSSICWRTRFLYY